MCERAPECPGGHTGGVVSSRFRFEEEWCLPAPPERVRETLVDLARYPEWWPQIRAVASVDSETAWLRCRSSLPYTLDLVVRSVSEELPWLEVALDGDLTGSVRWGLEPCEGSTRMRLRQEVEVRGVLVPASYLAHGVLRWNHARMMAGAQRGLRRRVAEGADPG